MSSKKIFIFSIIFFICGILTSCNNESSEKCLTSFCFEVRNNPQLQNDITAKIINEKILVILPAGINVKELIPSFTFLGSHVSVNDVVQISGSSINDFTSPVKYVVWAADNSAHTYITNFDLDSDYFITDFYFEKRNNPNLQSDIYAIISKDSIIVNFPLNTNLSSLVATFVTNANKVTVAGDEQISGITTNNFNSPLHYCVEIPYGETRIITVIAGVDNVISYFSIRKELNPDIPEDIIFSIDHEKNTIEATYLQWIHSETPLKFIPSFNIENAKVFYDDKEIKSNISSIEFKYPMYLNTYSGSNSSKIYSINIYCPQIISDLPVLCIETSKPINSKEEYVDAKLKIIGNGIKQGLWDFNDEQIKIRLRGNTTMTLPKKPYRIKFPKKYSPLGLNHAEERSWVLLANDCDKTLIRNAIALRISEILNSDVEYSQFTASTQFVDLYINGLYEGNYHLTDQIEVADGRIEVETLSKRDGDDPKTIAGGYLLEIDGYAQNEPLHFFSSRGMPVTIKYPREDDYHISQFNWIKKYFMDVEDLLFSPDFKDINYGWRKNIDEISLVNYYILSELTGNGDAWWSTYISKKREPDKLFFGPVWDFDVAFNNDNRITNATNRLMAEAAHNPKLWINRLMEDETFKSSVKSRWENKKNELLTVINYIDILTETILISQEVNFKRWDINYQAFINANPPPQSFEEGINQLRCYLIDRYNFLNSEFNKW